MGVADGEVIGPTKTLDNGPDTERFPIVLVAEGFTQAQQGDFEARCQELVSHLHEHPDFGPMMPAINIHRLNVASNESGADNPVDCGSDHSGSGDTPNTYFDARFCSDGQLRRSLVVDDELVLDTLNQHVPLWLAALVIVNSTVDGGTGGILATTSLSEGWLNTAVHELGHSAFDLADEYDYHEGTETAESSQAQYTDDEPLEVNVTTVTDRALLKWSHLVPAAVGVPTLQNFDCSQTDGSPNPLTGELATAVGLFEGGRYFRCGVYRPAYNCAMRAEGERFCAVCREAIHGRLAAYLPLQVLLYAQPQVLDFGNVPLGATVQQELQISNPGLAPATGIVVTSNHPDVTLLDPPAELDGGSSAYLTVALEAALSEGPFNGQITVSWPTGQVTVELGGVLCEGEALSQVRIDGSPSNPLDFGGLLQGATSYKAMVVLSYYEECGADLNCELPALPPPFFWADLPPGEAQPDGAYRFVMPAGDEPFQTVTVMVGCTAPEDAIGLLDHDFMVYTDGSGYQYDWPVTAVVTVLAPEPVDFALVIDRSGSMGSPVGPGLRSARDVAAEAASLFINLMAPEHRAALVRYNGSSEHPEDVVLELTEDREALLGALASDAFASTGSTAIGQGMLNGSFILSEAEATNRAILVLTDGRQNTGIGIEEARTEIEAQVPAQRVWAVGIGLDQYQREVSQIATGNGGAAFVTGELNGSREFLLHKLYAQVLADASGGGIVKDPSLALLPGKRRSMTIELCGLERGMDFAVICRPNKAHPASMRVWLEAPDGRWIDASVAAATEGFSYREGRDHVVFGLDAAHSPEWRGSWKIWVFNAAEREDLHYSVIALARATDLLLSGRAVQTSYELGATIEFVLEPTLYGQPIAPVGGAHGLLEYPDGATEVIELLPGTDGRWRGKVLDTSRVGAYTLSVELSFARDKCAMTRYRMLTGSILGRIAEREKRPELEAVLLHWLQAFGKGLGGPMPSR